MWAAVRAVEEIVYGQQELWGGITSVIWTGLVFLGGLGLWWLVSWILEYMLLGAERATLWIWVSFDKGKSHVWGRRQRTVLSNFLHVLLHGIFFGGVLLIFWIACASSGFNPWTTGAATLGMGIFLTYVFITPLGLFGSGLAVLASGIIAPGQYWEFNGYPGYDGRIISIWTLQVELERFDVESQAAEIVVVPINMFLSSMAKRNMHRELNAVRVTRTDNPYANRVDTSKGTKIV